MSKQIHILAFAGSLRKNSYNKSLLSAAIDLTPPNAQIEVYDLDNLPLFNQDLEYQMPEKVCEFKKKVKDSDAILIATPEYNYSFPGVLKNAIDWASRPLKENSLKGKPVALMSTSTGMLGGARAQYHLRQVFVALDMHPVNIPEVIVTFAGKRFDINGKLIDMEARGFIMKLLENLVNLTVKLKGD